MPWRCIPWVAEYDIEVLEFELIEDFAVHDKDSLYWKSRDLNSSNGIENDDEEEKFLEDEKVVKRNRGDR